MNDFGFVSLITCNLSSVQVCLTFQIARRKANN